MAKAVILAGGQGERFWPLTHGKFPKYLLRLDGGESLLQRTYRRLLGVYGEKNIYVVTTREHARLIRKELPRLSKDRIFLEPFARNTAPAILMATSKIAGIFGSEEIVSFFPADHLIQDKRSFKETLQKAVSLARKKPQLVILGIQPTFPATGYGYIEKGASLSGQKGIFRVKRFKEKPNRRRALTYLRSGKYFWNAGIFTWRAGVCLESFRRHSAPIFNSFDVSHLAKSYREIPKISIDYALLEKADNLAMVQTTMDWCDMGNWDSFLEKALTDKNKSHVRGLSLHKNLRDSLILNFNGAPIVTLGVTGLIVVQTSQGTLICRRRLSEEAALLHKKERFVANPGHRLR